MSTEHDERLARFLGGPNAGRTLALMIESGMAANPVEALVQIGVDRERAEQCMRLNDQTGPYVRRGVERAAAGDMAEAIHCATEIMSIGGPATLAAACWFWAREPYRHPGYDSSNAQLIFEDAETGERIDPPTPTTAGERGALLGAQFTVAALHDDIEGTQALFKAAWDDRDPECVRTLVEQVLTFAGSVRREPGGEQ
ncbi:MAG TPA: hypothetical protein VFV01_47865 [Spirillospora sp.]|nr:hypothetical protein [Spirillospora sp.]